MVFFSLKKGLRGGAGLFILSFFMLVILFFRTYVESFFYKKSYIADFTFTQFLFSYENGFVKRGLVGEIFSKIFEVKSYEVVCIVATLFLFILCGMLIFIFLLPYIKGGRDGLFLFFLVAVNAPSTIQHFIYDVGRFDIFTLIISILCLYLIRQKKIMACIIVVFLLGITLLIHEASFFLFIPFILSYWFYIDSTARSVFLLGITIFVLVLSTYFISTYGLLSEGSVLHSYEKFKTLYGDRVNFSSLAVLYRGSVVGNMEYTFKLGLTWLRLFHHLIMLTLLMPFFFIIWKILTIFFMQNSFKLKILIFSALTPLILYPLGHDHFRWWSIVFTNLFLIIGLVLIDSDILRERVSDVLERYSKICKVAAFSGIFLGPLGVTNSLLIR